MYNFRYIKVIILSLTFLVCKCFSNISITSFGSSENPHFSVNNTFTSFTTITQSASSLQLSGTDQNSLYGDFTTLDLSSYTENQLTLYGNVTVNPLTNFSLDLYDSSNNIATYSSTSYSNLSSGASLSFVSYTGTFDWANVNGLQLLTGGAGSSLTFSLTGLEIVPEPSNYASIIGFVALSLALLRRRGVMVKNL